MSDTYPHRVLRHYISGAIARGEAEPITEQPTPELELELERMSRDGIRYASDQRDRVAPHRAYIARMLELEQEGNNR